MDSQPPTDNQAGIAKSTADSTGLSLFEKLPAEIRWKIYDELLRADNVRQHPNEEMVCEYHFEPAILLANKRIHNDAWPVLYHENHFIKASSNWEHIFTSMTDKQVAGIACTKPKLVARFKEEILRLHVDAPWVHSWRPYGKRKEERVLGSFLLVANELSRFVRMLLINNVVYSQTSYKLKLRIENNSAGPPSLPLQQLVLEPFRCMAVDKACLQINGAVNADYAMSLKESMYSSVHWVRGLKWHIYDLGVSIKAIGDEAFRLGCVGPEDLQLGYMRTAFEKYQYCPQILAAASHSNPQLSLLEDDGFDESWGDLIFVAAINGGLAHLKMRLWNCVLGDLDLAALFGSLPEFDSSVCLPQQVLVHQYRGIACAALRNIIDAAQEFDVASALDPNNDLTKRFKDIIDGTLHGTADLSDIYSSAVLKSFDKPLPLPAPVRKGSKYIASERYLLRHLGYQGGLLPEIEEKEPINMVQIRKVVKDMEHTLKEGQKAGKRMNMMWVGDGRNWGQF